MSTTAQSSRPRSARVIRPLFRVVTIAYAVFLLAQPVLAGLSLDDVPGALDLHYTNGTIVLALAVLQFIVAVLWWKPAGGAWWPAVLALVVYGAGVLQMEAGHSSTFALHLPLGIGLILASAVLIVAAFSKRGLRRASRAVSPA